MSWFKKHKNKTDYPLFWKEYLKLFLGHNTTKTPIENLRFVVLDTETTGINLKKDELLSIGAVAVKNWKIFVEDRFECYLKPQKIDTGESITIHGILPIDRQESLEEQEAIKNFLQYCQNDILVGHHILFDVGMLNKSLKRMLGNGKLKNKAMDTQWMANRLRPAYETSARQQIGLDHLCASYGIPTFDRHTASGDAYITAQLFLKLLYRLQLRGINTLGDLFRR